LAIVRHLVELHGGTVTAESPGEGLGATFIVMLPFALAESFVVASEHRNSLGSGSGTQVMLDGVRILAVDDDADARELLEMVLRDSGAEVRSVPSTRAALDELERFCADLLMSDVVMPE